ncbi:MAG: TetR family transcriptional regulator [Ignavibacteriae bacterium]|nr:TetR family transcriptional regulator [Ignavibacteriota bacterium]
MSKTLKTGSSKRIINSAAYLFSRKGYSGVGVREIAAKARINISMVSYYYGGKAGLLKAIVTEYFSYVDDIALRVAEMKLPPRESLKEFICEMVNLIKDKEDLCKVAIIEMPIELPEITAVKVELLKNNMRLMSQSLSAGFNINDPKKHIIIGPAFLSLIFSGFMFGNLIKKISKDKRDDDFCKRYCETISALFLDGMSGFVKSNKKEKKK